MSEWMRSTCDRGCADACGLLARVSEGRIVELKGDPQHPATRGALCSQGNDYLKRQYAKDRLTHPLRRTDGGLERVSWDDALDLVAERLLHFRDSYGHGSVLVVDYSLPGWVNRTLLQLFWDSFGATFTYGGLSMETAVAGQRLDFGATCTHDAQDLLNARAVVAWGSNPYVTRQHWARVINAARKQGTKLVAVDTVLSTTAKRADVHYQLRPGSDGTLALGVARVLIERDAIDHEFIARHSDGFDGYRDLVFSLELDEVARRTGLAVSQIEALADLYADTHPVATIIGHGPSYWENGGAQVRLVDALVAMSGNVGVPGGGASTDVIDHPPFGLTAPQAGADPGGRKVLLPRLGDEILAAQDPPLKMGWIAGANPAASVPNTSRVQEGLRSLEFLVVVEQFMTATAHLADLVLPCTTFLETDDLVTTYGHHWVSLSRRVVAPPGEAKSDVEILQLLAERLGSGSMLAGAPDQWIARLLEPVAGEEMDFESLLLAPRLDPQAVAVPFGDRRFPTASGRFQFVQRFRPIERGGEGLRLLAPKTRRMMNSQVLPEDLSDAPLVQLSPAVALRLGLAEGDTVLVRSAVGEVRARLLTADTVGPDAVLFVPSAWRGDLTGVNQLREARLSDIGDCAAMNETRVFLLPLEV